MYSAIKKTASGFIGSLATASRWKRAPREVTVFQSSFLNRDSNTDFTFFRPLFKGHIRPLALR